MRYSFTHLELYVTLMMAVLFGAPFTQSCECVAEQAGLPSLYLTLFY